MKVSSTKKRTKFLDMEDIFLLRWKENNECSEYPFLLTLQKDDNYFVIGTPDSVLFKGLLAALKKYCVLESFSHDYNISELLGTGHFASVYLVSHKESGEKFAAKVIIKNSKEFLKNKVIFFQ